MVNSFEEVPARDRVIVALDCGIEEAFDLADQLQGKATWMKVGMTLFYANGPAIVYALKEPRRPRPSPTARRISWWAAPSRRPTIRRPPSRPSRPSCRAVRARWRGSGLPRSTSAGDRS